MSDPNVTLSSERAPAGSQVLNLQCDRAKEKGFFPLFLFLERAGLVLSGVELSAVCSQSKNETRPFITSSKRIETELLVLSQPAWVRSHVRMAGMGPPLTAAFPSRQCQRSTERMDCNGQKKGTLHLAKMCIILF